MRGKQKTCKLSKLFNERLHTKSLKWSSWTTAWVRLHELKVYSLHRRSERYIIIYIWKITQHMEPNIDGTVGHNIRKHLRHGTLRYSASNKQKPSATPSRKCNNCVGIGCTTRCQNIWKISKVLKLKNSNLRSTNF